MKAYFPENIGFISAGFLNLCNNEAYIELTENGAILVDVREPGLVDFKRFAVPDIIYLPFSQFKNKYQELPTDKALILADSVGLRSNEAMVFLKSLNYSNLANLPGGIVDWERGGYPIEMNLNEKYIGSCMCQLRQRNKIKH